MIMIRMNQYGLAGVIELLLIAVIIGGVSFTAWRVREMGASTNKTVAQTESVLKSQQNNQSQLEKIYQIKSDDQSTNTPPQSSENETLPAGTEVSCAKLVQDAETYRDYECLEPPVLDEAKSIIIWPLPDPCSPPILLKHKTTGTVYCLDQLDELVEPQLNDDKLQHIQQQFTDIEQEVEAQ